MSWPFPCRPACRLHALGVHSRGPPGGRYFCPCLPARGFGSHHSASPDYPTQQRKGTEKAEGKIKGGGTSLAQKAVCTGVGGDTEPASPGAEIVFDPQRHWLRSVPDTPYCDQLGGV
jgi:hypothetical protein